MVEIRRCYFEQLEGDEVEREKSREKVMLVCNHHMLPDWHFGHIAANTTTRVILATLQATFGTVSWDKLPKWDGSDHGSNHVIPMTLNQTLPEALEILKCFFVMDLKDKKKRTR